MILPRVIYSCPFKLSIQKTIILRILYSGTMKRPSQYASEIKISPVYLNEAVKSTTGFSVRNCIQNEIILQAKRLLYYTDLTIKETALKLGYDD